MEQGFVQSTGSIFWSRKKRKAYPAALEAEGDVVLSYRSWLGNFTDFAHICRVCGKVIISVQDIDGE